MADKLYVSCVPGKPVSRLPLPGRPRRGVVILGAVREGGALRYNPDEVLELSEAEVAEHGRVYERAIREGYLVRRSQEDLAAWVATVRAREAQQQITAPDGAQNGPASPAGGN